MNILSIIKLKKVFGQLDNLTPEEELFFQLHDNLHYEGYALCNSNGGFVFCYDLEYKQVWFQSDRVWLVSKSKFSFNY